MRFDHARIDQFLHQAMVSRHPEQLSVAQAVGAQIARPQAGVVRAAYAHHHRGRGDCDAWTTARSLAQQCPVNGVDTRTDLRQRLGLRPGPQARLRAPPQSFRRRPRPPGVRRRHRPLPRCRGRAGPRERPRYGFGAHPYGSSRRTEDGTSARRLRLFLIVDHPGKTGRVGQSHQRQASGSDVRSSGGPPDCLVLLSGAVVQRLQ